MVDTTRDLWWEARQKTAKMRPSISDQVKTFIQSLPGQPACERMGMLPFAVEGKAVVADLNLYRPGYNLKALQDRGINRWRLRMGGPRAWVEAAWKYEEDTTWRPYMDALDKLGIDVNHEVTGYFIHNAAEDWTLQGDLDTHIRLISSWTSGGYMPGSFSCDHEIANFWRGGTKIQITDFNLVESLASVTNKVVKKWRKVCDVYTAGWFIEQYARLQHATYFDNINRPEAQGGVGKQRPAWLAWVPQTALGSTVWNKAQDCISQLLTPNGDQLAKYLNIGNYTQYDLWQFLFAFRTPEMVAANQSGIDLSVSRGTLAEYDATFGLSSTPDGPPPSPGEYVTAAEFGAYKTETAVTIAKLAAKQEEGHTHAISISAQIGKSQ